MQNLTSTSSEQTVCAKSNFSCQRNCLVTVLPSGVDGFDICSPQCCEGAC